MKRNIIILLAVSLAIAGVISWFASSHPDGLERIAIDRGFEHAAESPQFQVLPGYTVPGMNPYLSTAIAGILGTLVTFGVVILIGRLLTGRHHEKENHAPPSH